MWVCLNCGHTFSEPKLFVDMHGLDTPPYEEYNGCPQCGEAYTEAYVCDCCGEWIIDKYVKTEDGCRYCSECYFEYDLGDEDN